MAYICSVIEMSLNESVCNDRYQRLACFPTQVLLSLKLLLIPCHPALQFQGGTVCLSPGPLPALFPGCLPRVTDA